ncbi:uncharacterized protein EI97DRAFT_439636 [Westerdykella ornata]|uniref:Uncharacterized protein n=1 Tax=Westerdykella ornata TaxID=318751 RepID=A0A6A6JSL4_WESOR|nr:uncharacterized protein EI97DRAFT_439636 [Westerdykella ornata]KAF2279255.1 hypothetical protein EI97DRAFT_439636 [Westerdykella ornata]
MPLSQRRRPPPLVLLPRQTATPTVPAEAEDGEEGPESPDSVGTTPGPDSPDSPSTSPALNGEEEKEDGEKEGQEGDKEKAPASTAPDATTTTATQPSQTGSSSQISSPPHVTRPPSVVDDGGNPPNLALPLPSESPTTPTTTLTLPASPTSTALPGVGSGGASADTSPPQRTLPHDAHSKGLSKGAEAALVTLTVLGTIAVLVGLLFWLRKRRRAKQEDQMRQTEDGDTFGPNPGGLQAPEMVHSSHLTRTTTTTTNSLFAAAEYQRPETVSTDKARSRIPDPQPTPNPFADPPLNKAYDMLRGRPRSTTLTDRGSWIKNPFKDPVSERFDPFGELQEKARQERIKYMEEMQREQDYLGREESGAVDDEARKGSSVTVEGLGVLDRSGDSRGYPR